MESTGQRPDPALEPIRLLDAGSSGVGSARLALR